MIKDALNKVMNQIHLTEEEMLQVMTEIMNGEVDPILLSAFLTSLKIKGETAIEIAAAAKVMREKAERVALDDYNTIDTCGTGGDGACTFNISTGVAFILAAAGIKVVKHGNRSVSSQCGSADVLEALNIKIDLDKEQVKQCVIDENIGFLFAPLYHQAMKHAMPVRKTLGFRTLFNVLGPLSNPAFAKYQLLGVYDESLTEVLAEALNKLGVKRALVVHGMDGLDEITLTTTTKVTELKNGQLSTYQIDPRDFGLQLVESDRIKGGNKEENAQLLIQLFKGEKGAKRDILLLNAGAALYVSGLSPSIEAGIILSRQLIDEGAVYDKLEAFRKYTGGLV